MTRPDESGIFETGTGVTRRALDRLARLVPAGRAPRGAAAAAALLAVALLVSTSAVFHSARGGFEPAPDSFQQNTPTVPDTPSASPMPTPQPIEGQGPIVVWTSQQVPGGDIGIYGLDLDAIDNGAQPVLLGTVQVLGNEINGPAGLRSPVAALPFVINTNGVNELLQVTRQGVTTLNPGIGFPQTPGTLLLSRDGKTFAVLVNGDRGLALHLQNLETGRIQEVPLKVPASIQDTSFSPALIAWYDHERRFLLQSRTFAASASAYSLTLSGSVAPMPSLNDLPVEAGTILADQKSFIFSSGRTLRIAGTTGRARRILARLSEDDFESPLVSPDGSRVAYTTGYHIKVARTNNGHVLFDSFLDPPANLTSLEWIDDSRLIVLATSTNFTTQEPSEALMLFDSDQAQGSPPTVFLQPLVAGGQDLNFLGLLR